MLKGVNQSEKKALRNFLTLYALSTLLLLGVGSFYYYKLETNIALESKKIALKEVKQNFIQHAVVPQNVVIEIVEDNALIAQKTENIFEEDGFLYFISGYPDHFKKNRKLLIKTESIDDERVKILEKIALFLIIAFIFIFFVALKLSSMFLKPLREKIEQMDNFIKDATHELNTPISAILMASEMIEVAKNKNIEEKLKTIKNSARLASMLYDDMLYANFSDKFKIRLESVEICALLEEIKNIYEPLCESKNIYIKLDCEQESIVTDRNRLFKIVSNILSNAIKYNKKSGKITVRARQNEIAIIDNGIGINAKLLDKIFDRYYRGIDEKGGLGLGLNIVKKLSNELGLKIEAESKQDTGTRFTIKF